MSSNNSMLISPGSDSPAASFPTLCEEAAATDWRRNTRTAESFNPGRISAENIMKQCLITRIYPLSLSVITHAI